MFIINIIIHSYGLGMMIWIESVNTEDSYIWGMTGMDAYILMKLFLVTKIFIIHVLISRGWCITKEADALNQLDRQLLFLQTLGITFANVLATNYINKIAVISLILIYSVVFRVLVLSVDQLIRSLRLEIESLMSSSRNIPEVLLDSIKLRKKTLARFKYFLFSYYILLVISKSTTFFLPPLWIVASEIFIQTVVMAVLTILFRKRASPTISVKSYNGQIQFSVHSVTEENIERIGDILTASVFPCMFNNRM